MAKSKRKTRSEQEHLRGLIRNLKSENRNLRKRIKELTRKEHQFDEVLDSILEEEDVKVDYEMCKECARGVLEEVDLGMIIVASCKICGFREKRKSQNEKEKSS